MVSTVTEMQRQVLVLVPTAMLVNIHLGARLVRIVHLENMPVAPVVPHVQIVQQDTIIMVGEIQDVRLDAPAKKEILTVSVKRAHAIEWVTFSTMGNRDTNDLCEARALGKASVS